MRRAWYRAGLNRHGAKSAKEGGGFIVDDQARRKLGGAPSEGFLGVLGALAVRPSG